VLACDLLDGVRAGGEEGVGEIGDDEADEFGTLTFEETRGLILPVAELGDGGLYFFAGGGADGRMVIDDPGDGHESYASELGDFSDCGSARLALRHGNQHNRRVAENGKKRRVGVAFRTFQRRRVGLPVSLILRRLFSFRRRFLGMAFSFGLLLKGEQSLTLASTTAQSRWGLRSSG